MAGEQIVLTGLTLNGKNIENLADPTTAQQAATKAYVDAQINARSPKDDVLVHMTTNVNLSSPGATLDGVSFSAGQRFSTGGQTTGSQNGIYVWNGAAVAATRAPDADSITELSGAVFAVQRGTNADKLYLITNDDTDTLGSTTINIVPTATGGTYTADGQGIELSGSQFALELDSASGLSKSASGLKVDYTVVARKVSFDCAATTNPQTFTHNFNTKDVDVVVRDKSTDEIILCRRLPNNVNSVEVNFGGAPTAAQYRITVIG